MGSEDFSYCRPLLRNDDPPPPTHPSCSLLPLELQTRVQPPSSALSHRDRGRRSLHKGEGGRERPRALWQTRREVLRPTLSLPFQRYPPTSFLCSFSPSSPHPQHTLLHPSPREDHEHPREEHGRCPQRSAWQALEPEPHVLHHRRGWFLPLPFFLPLANDLLS